MRNRLPRAGRVGSTRRGRFAAPKRTLLETREAGSRPAGAHPEVGRFLETNAADRRSGKPWIAPVIRRSRYRAPSCRGSASGSDVLR